MTFWIICGALALVVTILLGLAIVRGRRDGEAPAAYDLRVYRDQLKEVDRDLARGVVSPEDGERTRAEISRRILAADGELKKAAATGSTSNGPARAMAAVAVLAVTGGAFALYSELGAPGYDDLPLQRRIEIAHELSVTRPSQAEAEKQVPPRPAMQEPSPEYQQLMQQLRAAVAERPNDPQGLRLLARNESMMGNYRAGYSAQETLLSVLGDQATATDYAQYGSMLVVAAGGFVSPEAEAAFMAALARDPQNGMSRYYMGLMSAQNGRPDRAFDVWRDLLNDSAPDAPWLPPLRAQIEEAAFRAGAKFELPAAETAPMAAPNAPLSGPTADDVQNAADLTPAERQDMIRGMVEQLNERLATEGGTPAEWSRLISSLGMLGEQDRARAIWGEAQARFADHPDALAEIRAGAARAGVAE